MLKTTESLYQELWQYKNPQTRIRRMVDQKILFQVKRGIYEDNRFCPPEVLAAVICGPSYLSFEYALGNYGLIPERVIRFLSATLRKNRTKEFSNIFGTYGYQDIPAEVFPYGITIQSEGDASWLIACPEKALCDTLYLKKPVADIRELEKLLFDSLRIEEEDFWKMDRDFLVFLSGKYHDRNLKLLRNWLRRAG